MSPKINYSALALALALASGQPALAQYTSPRTGAQIDAALTKVIATDAALVDVDDAIWDTKQAADADLDYWAGYTPSAFVQSLLDDADSAAFLATLGLVVGTNVQAYDADLAALAALAGTDTLYYRSAADTWTAVTIGANLTFAAGELAATGGGSADTLAATVTASATQTQVGATLIDDTINRITTAASSGDAVRLDEASLAKKRTILNLTANPVTVWPADGGDLGYGSNQSATLLAGQTVTYLGLDSTSWDEIVSPIPDDSTIEISGGTLRVKDNAISLAKLAHGTASQLIGYDDTGVPIEIDPDEVGGSKTYFVDAFPGSGAHEPGATYIDRLTDTGRAYELTGLSYATFTATYTDLDAPTIVSAEIEATGDYIRVTPSEALVAGTDPDTGFDLDSSSATDNAMTFDSLIGGVRRYALASTIYSSDQSINLDFTQLGDGLQDNAGNPLATFAGFTPVVNGSTLFAYIVNEPFTATELPTSGLWAQIGGGTATFPGGYANMEYTDQSLQVTLGTRPVLKQKFQFYLQNLEGSSQNIATIRNTSGTAIVNLNLTGGTVSLTGAAGPSAHTLVGSTTYYAWFDYDSTTGAVLAIAASDARPSTDGSGFVYLTSATVNGSAGYASFKGRGASRAVRLYDYKAAAETIP